MQKGKSATPQLLYLLSEKYVAEDVSHLKRMDALANFQFLNKSQILNDIVGGGFKYPDPCGNAEI